MGGNLAWTIRLEDGTEYRMDRWTNVFPTITFNDAFLNGEPEAIQESLNSWLEMKEDWEKNYVTGDFALHMTPVYAPYPFGLKPSEYGFVVTDFVTKTIISCQHYTTIGRFHLYSDFLMPEMLEVPDHPMALKSLFDQMPGGKAAFDKFMLDQGLTPPQPAPKTTIYGEPMIDQYNLFKRYHEEGRIAGVQGKTGQWIPVDGLTFEEVIATAEFFTGRLGYALIKPVSPWTVLDFDKDTKKGRKAAYKAVRDLGFTLSPDEKEEFTKWAAMREYDDA